MCILDSIGGFLLIIQLSLCVVECRCMNLRAILAWRMQSSATELSLPRGEGPKGLSRYGALLSD